MSIRVACPACERVYNLDDSMAGKKIRCRDCQEAIAVPAGRRSAEDRPDRDERIGPPPRGRSDAVRSRREDDEPRRRPDRRSRDDEDEDDRPRRSDHQRREESKGGSGGLVLILVGAGLAGLLAIGAVVGGLVWAVSSSSNSTPVADAPQPGANIAGQPPAPMQPAVPQPAIPAGPIPAEIAPDVVNRVKQSTAYLRVNLPSGGDSQGSGFFALERGIVITNAHVLGMLRADSLAPRSVEVVVHSGETNESKRTATVLGVDRGNDLAVLRVEGDPSSLPAPLPVDSARGLTETQKVYVFGFPFGAQLGKNITVSPSTITALRKNASGVLEQLQVNGGMQPGNSGGPVTDARGVVVGVSVSIITGTQINFAIPGDFVKQVVDGKITKTDTGYAYRSEGAVRLPVALSYLDPMNRIRQVKVDVWIGLAGNPLEASTSQPAARPGDGPRQSFALTIKDGRYVGDVTLPAAGAGQVVWIQPMLVNGAGASLWETATAVPAEAQNPIERRSATIQFKAPAAAVERTLKLSNHKKYTLFKGKSSLTFEDKLQGNAVEALAPEAGKGTRCRLVLGDCPYSSQIGEKTIIPPPPARDLLRKFGASFLISPDHACATATKSNFRNLRSPYKEAVMEMYEAVTNAYEGTTLPVPNREIRPQETWSARMPLYVRSGPRLTVQHVFLTCTLEGVRSINGRNQALVSLKGRVKGIGRLANVELGKVSGDAHFDIDGGFVSQVKLITTTELENEEANARLLVQAETTVVRTEGNSLGLTPPPVGPIARGPDTPMTPTPAVPGGPLQNDLAALKGTWQSGNVTGDGSGAKGTIKLLLQPGAGVSGRGKLEIATERNGRTTTSTRTFSFSLQQRGEARLIVSGGKRGPALVFVYRLEGEQLLLTGKVVGGVGYTLTNIPLKRISNDAAGVPGGAPAGDPTKPADPKGVSNGAAEAIKITGDVYDFVKSAVEENRLTDGEIKGHKASMSYRDVPARGALLIGFQVGLGRFGRNATVQSWRPIFRTKAKASFGQWVGPVPAAPVTLKAKPGYVVCGVTVRVGAGFDNMTVHFAKLGPEGLDLKDAYNSPTAGGPGGFRNETIGNKGQLYVGITGSLRATGPTSLGLVAVLPRE